MTQKGTARVEVETITFSQDKTLQNGVPKVKSTTQARLASNKNIKNKNGASARYVQVGAYSVHKTAQKLAKVLDREIRLPVKITSINSKGRKLYRVRIGPVPTEKLALQLIDTLDIKELGKPKMVYE